jgi:nicotinate phosphoribosyltransferase
MPDAPPRDALHSALFTDMYELTMAQAYDAEGMNDTAVFELLFRNMPGDRNYFVAAGLDDVLAYLESFHVTDDDLAWLRRQGMFAESFLQRLGRLRFRGDVCAVPEGTIVFPGEPLLQIVAPLLEAQIVEMLVLNQIHFQTLAATKAARVVLAAAGRPVVDFGSRRAHGADAALKVARASYLVGAVGTSNVLAGKTYGIPVSGTMAHSYVQAHNDESQAFEAFARLYPETTLLVDTYDTIQGVQKVIDLGRKLGAQFRVRSIRLDSGDLGALARKARQMLDAAGLTGVRIFASGGLDENQVASLVREGAPIDVFGVGTKLAVSEDVPSLDMAYKLVEYAGIPRMKLSAKKVVLPGRKQVFRQAAGGRLVGDVIGQFAENLPGEPLLHDVMRGGKRLPGGRVTLEEARRYARAEQNRLPESLRQLKQAAVPYPVEVSAALARESDALRRALEQSLIQTEAPRL